MQRWPLLLTLHPFSYTARLALIPCEYSEMAVPIPPRYRAIFLMNAVSIEEAEATVDTTPLVAGRLAECQFGR